MTESGSDWHPQILLAYADCGGDLVRSMASVPSLWWSYLNAQLNRFSPPPKAYCDGMVGILIMSPVGGYGFVLGEEWTVNVEGCEKIIVFGWRQEDVDLARTLALQRGLKILATVRMSDNTVVDI